MTQQDRDIETVKGVAGNSGGKQSEPLLNAETPRTASTGPQGFPADVPASSYNAVEPPHYQRGPIIKGHIGSAITMGRGQWEHTVAAIEVFRHIQDPRLATAFKYLWRVAFGGKNEPWDTRTSEQVDARDIRSAIWYLQDWLDNPVDRQQNLGPVSGAGNALGEYDATS